MSESLPKTQARSCSGAGLQTHGAGVLPSPGMCPPGRGLCGLGGAKQGEGGGGTRSGGGEVLLWKQITCILQRKHKFCLIGGKCREEEKDNISKKFNETWIVHSHSPGVRNGSRGRTGGVYNPAHAQRVAAALLPAPRVPMGSPNLSSAARLLQHLRAAAAGAPPGRCTSCPASTKGGCSLGSATRKFEPSPWGKV